jgi:2-polyprenyl-3-methyl-5-hydroxy-6-metoxy-1,4-benzoquinol methylase
MPVDEAKLMEFVYQAVGDLGAALTATLVNVGDRLGLYRAMAGKGPMTAAELATTTDTTERYVAEWLAGQAASGYISYEGDGRYRLPDEQAVALTDEDSPACVLGGFQAMTAAMRAEPKIIEAFRSGGGVGWHEHDPGLFEGTERFFRPGYLANLVGSWIPALDGIEAKLRTGGKIADVGCGHGASTLIMAKAYPESSVVGYDYHQASIDAARKRATEAGVSERATFEQASAKDYSGTGFDLIAFFDCLHDMGDPVGALAHARQALAPEGAVMLVEPFANDDIADNMNPLGRVFYSVSTLVCTPASLSQEVGRGLGAQAGEARLREVAHEAGMTRFRRATETPFNLILELRP